MSLGLLSSLSTAFIVGSALLLLLGWYLIRRGKVAAHRTSMLAATALAALFLVVYVSRWSLYGSKPFGGEGVWRALYLANLIPHVLLAMLVGPLAIRLIQLALLKKDFPRHKRLGRITVPLWIYVAASGWLVYAMLYSMDF